MSVDVRFIRIFSHTHIDRYYLRREILRNNTGRHRTETHVIFSFFEKKKSFGQIFFFLVFECSQKTRKGTQYCRYWKWYLYKRAPCLRLASLIAVEKHEL